MFEPVRGRQVSKVTNCGIERIGDLEFDFLDGSCFSTDQYIVLCFDESNSKQCRLGTSALGTFQNIQKSTFGHRGIHMSVSNGNILMVLRD